ncbi:GNAT family N-acetyltransferase [Streptomyces akebiae]|uniref:GNAT family N-acetyltransferase n=1 Tax=Streptomyces akebiae TaxID=2865673 RepID=A0ABX8XIH9_9ACTN|nr:GNAT family N-acetyltransferase [Streptomyces akebiae]QYX75671.1 GNAT family N-acetyltransferase [Streptomyces akebiae]
MPAPSLPPGLPREANGQDMSDLLSLDRAAFPDDPMRNSTLRQLLDMYADHLLVIEDDDGHLCAYVLATPPYKGESWIFSLGVAPARRGKGLARTLMTQALETVRAEGASTVRLWVEPGNDPARALYESLGFTPDPEGPHADHFGPGAHRLGMTLKL